LSEQRELGAFSKQPGEAKLTVRIIRICLIAYIVALVVAMYCGALSNSKPGAMTFGPTTDLWAASIAISKIEHRLGGGLGYRLLSLEMAKHVTTTGSDIDAGDDGTRALNQDPTRVSEAFSAAVAIPKSALSDGHLESGTYVTTWAEDIGYADFYNVAFRLFGYSALSTYHLYFLILALSVALVVTSSFNSNLQISLLALAVTCLFLASTAPVFSPTVPSPAANRYLATLAIVPFVDFLGIIFIGARQRPYQIACLIAQAFLFAFALTLRSSAIWMVFALILLIFTNFLFARYAHRIAFSWWRPRVLPLVAILAAGFAFPAVRHALLNPVYSDEAMPNHMRWHSAVLGLTYHPAWNIEKPYPELPMGDGASFKWFEHYMRDTYPGEPITSPKVNNLYRVHRMEGVMKWQFLNFVVKHPVYIAELYMHYKPSLLFSNLGTLIAGIPLIAWLIAAPALIGTSILLFASTESAAALLTVALISWSCSALPAMWAYPEIHVMSDTAWATLFLIMMTALTASLALARRSLTDATIAGKFGLDFGGTRVPDPVRESVVDRRELSPAQANKEI
jgi:hypothetical protein